MSNSKTHHFDWRKLEDKPDNWETLRKLISICNTVEDIYSEKMDSMQWNEDHLDVFKDQIVRRYGKAFGGLFPKNVPQTDTNKNSKNNKKGKNNVRERIHAETDKKLISKDLETIRFDKKSYYPMTTTFKNATTFAFMIAEWNIMLALRSEEVGNGALVDAMISLDRICREEVLKDGCCERIQQFFNGLNKRCEKLLTRDEIFDELFVRHPELMVNPFSQKRAGRVALYTEQVRVITNVVDAVMANDALLLGDRMPPGTGKTFLAVPLAQKLAALRCGKTLLFACNNMLVRTDVATLALLGKNLHLWMGRCDTSTGTEEFLVRPHKSCFPVNWKQIYKTNDQNKTGSVLQQCMFYKTATGKFPDILVADLETCRSLLQEPLLQDQFVAYIDEFISEQKANRIMIDIVKNLPRQSVLLSAILPRFEDMPSVLTHFKNRHSANDDNVVRIEANQLTISCTIVDKDGKVALPHHFIEGVEQIPLLIDRIRADPLIGRQYSPQQVFAMIDHVQQDLKGTGFLFDDKFPTISMIDHAGVRNYVLELLEFVAGHPHIFEKMRTFRPQCMLPPDATKIATRDSNYYEGKTLVITRACDRFGILESIKSDLHAGAPDIHIMTDTAQKKKKELEKQLQLMQDYEKKGGSQARVDRTDHLQNMNRLRDEIYAADHVRWPERFIVNTPQHAKRYGHKLNRSAVIPILSSEYDTAFSDFLYTLMLSGIGVYDFSQCTEYQRRLTMKAVSQLSFLFAGDEIVFGTNIEGLTHMFIDGAWGDNVSRSVLLQCLGRSGRMGCSFESFIVVNSDATLQKIMSFIDLEDPDAMLFEQALSQELF